MNTTNTGKSKIRLLLVSVRADMGGGQKHLDYLIKSLKRSSMETFLAIPNDKPYFDDWISHQRVQDHILLPHRSFNFFVLFKVLRFVKRNKISVIHSHGKGAGIYSRLLSFLSGVPVVHTPHGIHWYKSKILNYVYLNIEKILAHFTNRIIAVSDSERLGWEGIIKSSSMIVSIRNGIERPMVKMLPDSVRFDSNQVVTISRYDYAKNMDLALEIVKALKSDFKFVWIGTGAGRKSFMDQARLESLPISFIDYIDDVPSMLNRAFVYMSTSRREGLPYALVEACSVGLPVVATDVPGNNDVVEHGKNGFLFNNVLEAVDALKILRRDFTLYQSLAKGASSTYENNFRIEDKTRQIIELYHSIA